MRIKAIQIFGSSMFPFLKDGFCFVDSKTRVFRKGDMVLYRFMDRLYIHRIYKIDGNKVGLSNDDNLPFHVIDKSAIYGKVISPFNGLVGYICGYFLRFVRKVKRFFYGCL